MDPLTNPVNLNDALDGALKRAGEAVHEQGTEFGLEYYLKFAPGVDYLIVFAAGVAATVLVLWLMRAPRRK